MNGQRAGRVTLSAERVLRASHEAPAYVPGDRPSRRPGDSISAPLFVRGAASPRRGAYCGSGKHSKSMFPSTFPQSRLTASEVMPSGFSTRFTLTRSKSFMYP